MRRIEGHDRYTAPSQGYIEKKEDMELHRANLLQLAWAERSCQAIPVEDREEAIQQWLLSHGKWFHDMVKNNEKNRGLLYQDINKETLDELDALFVETTSAH